MPWLEPITTAVTAAELASELAKSSIFIKKHAKRIAFRFKHGRALVPVFGAGGVGKTTVGKLLRGANPLDLATPYDESWDTDSIELIGDVPGQVLIAPGQETRVSSNWPQLMASVVAGQTFGVINVVSYGYHAFGLKSYREHDVFKSEMTDAEFMAAYTENRRNLELDMLNVLLAGLSAATKPMWMITLVTKQDLWWPQRVDVRKHYDVGPYASAIERFTGTLGAKNFQHDILPVSLVLGNFVTGSGEVLAPTSAGYDFAHHAQYLKAMFAKIDDRVRRGRRR